ncbi:MAG: hypothetical protein PW734_03395 [Verrucomicrobium sp.]|nr:hypothetical protein [Verrucomicrobium sp.]
MVLNPPIPTTGLFFGNLIPDRAGSPAAPRRLAAPAAAPEPEPGSEKKEEPAQGETKAETGIGGALLKCVPLVGGLTGVTHGMINMGQAAVAARKRQWGIVGMRALQGFVRAGAGAFNVAIYASLPFHHGVSEYILPSWGISLTAERQMENFDKRIKNAERLYAEGKSKEAHAAARLAEKEVLGSLLEDVPGLGDAMKGLGAPKAVGKALEAGRTLQHGKALFERIRPSRHKNGGLIQLGLHPSTSGAHDLN